jgi:hypothetical protein
MNSVAIKSPEVGAVFKTYSMEVKERLLQLRQLIFDIASSTDGVGELEETLKWGQPSYLTLKSKSGSTIRIHHVKSIEGQYAIYFNCNTNLVSTFRHIYPDTFKFEGNRAIHFNVNDDMPQTELSFCISLALTYHLNKRLDIY